jgi:hypothetical protein
MLTNIIIVNPTSDNDYNHPNTHRDNPIFCILGINDMLFINVPSLDI